MAEDFPIWSTGFDTEIDISQNYFPAPPLANGRQDEQWKARLSLRKVGKEYQVYAYYFHKMGAHGHNLEEVIYRTSNLEEFAKLATKADQVAMYRLYPEDSQTELDKECTRYVAVDDDIIRDIRERKGRNVTTFDIRAHLRHQRLRNKQLIESIEK